MIEYTYTEKDFSPKIVGFFIYNKDYTDMNACPSFLDSGYNFELFFYKDQFGKYFFEITENKTSKLIYEENHKTHEECLCLINEWCFLNDHLFLPRK